MTELILSDEMSPDGQQFLQCRVCERRVWGLCEFDYTDDATGCRETFRICVDCMNRAAEVIKAGLAATEDERG